jgi:2-oxoglutarate ferredoxin oxidoreductase subunit alpha
MDGARLAVMAYGTAARIAKGAIKRVREAGLKVGLFRPVTLWPFPEKILQGLDEAVENFLVFEMSTGQMLEDVKLSLAGRGEVHFYGRPGGPIPTPDEVAKVIRRLYHRQKL